MIRPPRRRGISFGDYVREAFPTERDKAEFRAQVERVHAIADLLDAIEQARAAAKMPKADLARRMETQASVVSRLLTSGGNPTVDTLLQILQQLGLHATLTIEPRRRRTRVLSVRSQLTVP
ncbi:MAG: helix-turn-helix domain-containing protein [Actinomycetota bacterium]